MKRRSWFRRLWSAVWGGCSLQRLVRPVAGVRLTYDMADITSGRSLQAVLPFVILTEQAEQGGKLPVGHALYLRECSEEGIEPLDTFGRQVELTYRTSKRALTNPAGVRKLLQEFGDIIVGGLLHGGGVQRPNDPSSATAATGRTDCNRDGPPPFAAAHG